MRRSKAIILTLGGIFVLGNIPSILGDNVFKNVTVFGKSIFDAFDYVSGNILFMLTALGCAIFVGFVLKDLSLIHISEPTRQRCVSRMPSSA